MDDRSPSGIVSVAKSKRRKGPGHYITGPRWQQQPEFKLHSAARSRGSAARRSAAGLWYYADRSAALATKTLPEHSGKQTATWLTAWITARGRVAARCGLTTNRLGRAADRRWRTTWFGHRAARLTAGSFWFKTAKQPGICGMRSKHSGDHSNGKQGKHTTH